MLVWVVAAMVVTGGGVTMVVARGKPAPVSVVIDPTLTTTMVRRTDMSDNRMLAGTLEYGTAHTVKGAGPGIVTNLPMIGAMVSRGKQLYRVNDQPVVVLYGDTPLFRPIDKPGISGRDVGQLRRNLTALGYQTWSANEETTDTLLLTALKRWQKKLGITAPGRLLPGQAVVLAGPGRVSALTAQLGDPADGPVLTVSATKKVVSVPMSPADADTVKRGAKVKITLPDAREVSGTVVGVSQTVTGDLKDGETPKMTVTISPTRAKDVAAIAAAPVQVRFTTVARKGVLAVPVGALLALREGGYALQRPDGSLLAATTGLFAGGMVQVSGEGISEGTTVVTTP